MNTTMSRGLIRLVAGPVAAAGIIGGALGLAAVANANTVSISPHTPNSTYTAAVKEQTGNGKWYHPTDAVHVGIGDAGPTRAVAPDEDGPLDKPDDGSDSAPSNMLGDR
ncbi:MAG TPA: hypothetical protein VHT50_02930 [Mycobacterium sp.]|jgi:hypothetical protein|nr:hypothetical protein [Mycobacterium sp.]